MQADGTETAARELEATVQVVTEPLGGSPLSQAIQRGSVPAHWLLSPPTTPDGWRGRIREVQQAFTGRQWLDAVGPALSPQGAGRERLERVAREQGVLVTTGQQPGLFGGPLYTWSKALTALALADAVERETGVPTAPVFWAATDDADLVEAQSVWVANSGGAVELRGNATAAPGTPASATPQGELRAQLDALRRSAGSAAGGPMLELAAAVYGNPSTTIGAAYIALLDAVLGPLGITVLDASHAAVREAGASVMRTALRNAANVAAALAERSRELRAHGFAPQVEDIRGLTPVFVYENGAKRRIALEDAEALGRHAGNGALGPNVLLRPVVECAILPTIAYVAGPGELAYFAQVTALADALEERPPMAVPRWSGTLVEPHMQRALDRLQIDRETLADPHAVDAALARAATPPAVRDALGALRAQVAGSVDALRAADTDGLLPPAVVEGLGRRLAHQLDRFDRRVLAAVKRRESTLMHDVAALRGYFFPGGKRQERALALVPMVARHGSAVLEGMLREARIHAARLVGGVPSIPSASSASFP